MAEEFARYHLRLRAALVTCCWASFSRSLFNYAAPAQCPDGGSAVLKICYPNEEFQTEVEALRLCAGEGAVQLFEADVDRGVMLLEYVKPGTRLSELKDDEEATSIAASVMRQLWKPAPSAHPFPSVADWAKGMGRLREQFDGGTGPFPELLVDRAEKLFPELLGSMAEPVVLHGDLHHFNILAAERQPWLAIDPKGVVGEPAYKRALYCATPGLIYSSGPMPARLLPAVYTNWPTNLAWIAPA